MPIFRFDGQQDAAVADLQGINQLIIGRFNATTAGSGIALGAKRTWAMRGNADDGGAALPINQAYLFGSRRLLLTYAQSGNISAFGGQDRLSVAGDETGITAWLAAHWGMLELKSGGKTPTATMAGAVRGDLAINSGSTLAAGGAACFLAACEALSASTHTGKYTVIGVPNPQAGTFDSFIEFGSATGCISAHAAGSPASLQILISIGGSPYALSVCAVGT